MYISKLSLVNYRNFSNAKLLFKKGTNTIIGENGSGKTNVFRAIRLLIDDNMLRSASRLEERDFHRGLADWRGHWIIISLEFSEISQDEAIQALFLHSAGVVGATSIGVATYNLIFRPTIEVRTQLVQVADGDKAGLDAIKKGITIDDYETIFTGKSSADFNDPAVYKKIVGDLENVKFTKELEFPEIGTRPPAILSLSREVACTFIQALRDVVNEFQNNRTNPLLTLLREKSGKLDPEKFKPIADQVKTLNTSIEGMQDVKDVTLDISSTIRDAAGETYSPHSLSIKSDLPEDAVKLFQSLRLFVGESANSYEGGIHELSLGGANLIYLTLKLLEFKYHKSRQTFANFLLIEEPEAHIHTHIQKTLFDRLNYDDTQIIYSTHSTHISEVSNVNNVNILSKLPTYCEAYQPATGMTPTETGSIQRYLDAVRNNLLFAKSVVLIEGDAEEILIPVLFKKVLGISLDELGISLVNIRSTGFRNVAILFRNDRIRKKCAIITDLDAAIASVAPLPGDDAKATEYKKQCKASQDAGISRKTILDAFAVGNPWLKVSYAPHTFEVDFLAAGNAATIVGILNDVYSDPGTIATAKSELESGKIDLFGKRALTMAKNEGKGWFAILLGKKIDHQAAIPDYILDGVFFAHGTPATAVISNILEYRVKCVKGVGKATPAVIAAFEAQLIEYRSGKIDLGAIRNAALTSFPEDQIHRILARF